MDNFEFNNFNKSLASLFQNSWFKLSNFFFNKNSFLISVYNFFLNTPPSVPSAGVLVYNGTLDIYPYSGIPELPNRYISLYNIKENSFSSPAGFLFNTNLSNTELLNLKNKIIYYNLSTIYTTLDFNFSSVNITLDFSNRKFINYCEGINISDPAQIIFLLTNKNYFFENTEYLFFFKNNSSVQVRCVFSWYKYTLAYISNSPIIFSANSLGCLKMVKISNKIFISKIL